MTFLLRPVYWAVWAHPRRRARKLLEFAEVEADGGRDLARAAELTRDPVLRRRFLAHARDEVRHAALFRERGMELRTDAFSPASEPTAADWIAPGERGLDDLEVDRETDGSLLAFIHLSEAAAARDFASYRSVLAHDPQTRALFDRILRDEEFHMRYARQELERVAPKHARLLLWTARLRRLWKAYLRLAMVIANAMSTMILTILYFVLLPPFAFFAKRMARDRAPGWHAAGTGAADEMGRQF